MRRQFKVTASSKDDIFRQATKQAAINRLYMSLQDATNAMNSMDNEDFDKIGLSKLYREAVNKIQDVYPYTKF